MLWKYFIPHPWEAERTTWEDIWLLPEPRPPGAESIWLTVDGCADLDPDIDAKLGDREYLIDGADMYVNVPDFSKSDLLDYASIWLETRGFGQVELREGDVAEFDGTNQHARMISAAVDSYRAHTTADDEDND